MHTNSFPQTMFTVTIIGKTPRELETTMDDTTPGLGPVTPTTAHPPPPADIALAYSDALELPDLPSRSRIPAIAFSLSAAALIVATTGWLILKPTTPTAVGTVARPNITISSEPPPPALPAPDTTNVEQGLSATLVPLMGTDDRFINELATRGLIVTNRDNVILAAHKICQYLNAGATNSQIVTMAQQSNPALTNEDAENIITWAVANYCPAAE
jgi:Protein of unknown function (DUF732)